MNKLEALDIIRQACASVVANLATHQKLQEALSIIDAAMKPAPAPTNQPAIPFPVPSQDQHD